MKCKGNTINIKRENYHLALSLIQSKLSINSGLELQRLLYSTPFNLLKYLCKVLSATITYMLR